MSMKVTITPGCVSCGLCVNLCPQVFQFGPLETAQVREQPHSRDCRATQEAASQCPVGVIQVEETRPGAVRSTPLS